jgi:hypothetical protein
MAAQKYKIRYKDSRTQGVTANTYGRHGDRYVFTLDGNEVLNLAADVVESIAYADIPEPELPEVEVATMTRSGTVRGFS